MTLMSTYMPYWCQGKVPIKNTTAQEVTHHPPCHFVEWQTPKLGKAGQLVNLE